MRVLLLPFFLLLASCGEREVVSEEVLLGEQALAELVVGLSASDVAAMREARQAPVLIDVRTPDEYAERHIEGARLMPLDSFDPAALDGELVVLYCRSGRRSAEAAEMLAAHRGESIGHLQGGINAWEEAGYPIETPSD